MLGGRGRSGARMSLSIVPLENLEASEGLLLKAATLGVTIALAVSWLLVRLLNAELNATPQRYLQLNPDSL
jgi:hypothetical protein